MPLNVRVDDDVAILSNFARLMNDPRYVDAGRDVGDLLGRGFRRFVLDLRGIREAGAPLLGLLMTLTRQVRRQGGEAVLAGVGEGLEEFFLMMQVDDYWDVFDGVEEARESFRRSSP
jgi:anti-sigma B factor antagonist